MFLRLLALGLLVSGPTFAGPHVRIHTALGDIEVELAADQAPGTVANFLKYVDAARYTGGQIHRTVTIHPDNQPGKAVKIEVIPGGVNPAFARGDFAPIPLGRTNVTGLHHLDGTLSMARDGPDSATSDFFICLDDQPALDFGGKRNPDGQGFAAFGRVVRGLDIVCQIQAAPADGQKLTPPIVILQMESRP